MHYQKQGETGKCWPDVFVSYTVTILPVCLLRRMDSGCQSLILAIENSTRTTIGRLTLLDIVRLSTVSRSVRKVVLDIRNIKMIPLSPADTTEIDDRCLKNAVESGRFGTEASIKNRALIRSRILRHYGRKVQPFRLMRFVMKDVSLTMGELVGFLAEAKAKRRNHLALIMKRHAQQNDNLAHLEGDIDVMSTRSLKAIAFRLHPDRIVHSRKCPCEDDDRDDDESSDGDYRVIDLDPTHGKDLVIYNRHDLDLSGSSNNKGFSCELSIDNSSSDNNPVVSERKYVRNKDFRSNSYNESSNESFSSDSDNESSSDEESVGEKTQDLESFIEERITLDQKPSQRSYPGAIDEPSCRFDAISDDGSYDSDCSSSSSDGDAGDHFYYENKSCNSYTNSSRIIDNCHYPCSFDSDSEIDSDNNTGYDTRISIKSTNNDTKNTDSDHPNVRVPANESETPIVSVVKCGMDHAYKRNVRKERKKFGFFLVNRFTGSVHEKGCICPVNLKEPRSRMAVAEHEPRSWASSLSQKSGNAFSELAFPLKNDEFKHRYLKLEMPFAASTGASWWDIGPIDNSSPSLPNAIAGNNITDIPGNTTATASIQEKDWCRVCALPNPFLRCHYIKRNRAREDTGRLIGFAADDVFPFAVLSPRLVAPQITNNAHISTVPLEIDILLDTLTGSPADPLFFWFDFA